MNCLSKVVFASIPDSLCNLDCSYCYAAGSRGQRGKYAYSVDRHNIPVIMV